MFHLAAFLVCLVVNPIGISLSHPQLPDRSSSVIVVEYCISDSYICRIRFAILSNVL